MLNIFWLLPILKNKQTENTKQNLLQGDIFFFLVLLYLSLLQDSRESSTRGIIFSLLVHLAFSHSSFSIHFLGSFTLLPPLTHVGCSHLKHQWCLKFNIYNTCLICIYRYIDRIESLISSSKCSASVISMKCYLPSFLLLRFFSSIHLSIFQRGSY